MAWVLVARFRTSSDGRKFWKVSKQRSGKTVLYGCDCPNFIYRHPVDGCKHIKAAMRR
jgi:hypothetical protein